MPPEDVEVVAPRIHVSRNNHAGRYEITVDAQPVGLAEFHRSGDVIVMPHVEIDPEFQGQGLAAELVKFALDDIAASGLTVRPACPYVAHFIRRHPQYQSLVAT